MTYSSIALQSANSYDSKKPIDIKLPVPIIQCVWKKRDQNVFCIIFYKTRAILMKFGTQFPE